MQFVFIPGFLFTDAKNAGKQIIVENYKGLRMYVSVFSIPEDCKLPDLFSLEPVYGLY